MNLRPEVMQIDAFFLPGRLTETFPEGLLCVTSRYH